MFGVETFQAVQAGAHQFRNDSVRAVQAGVRHDRESARLMDQRNRIERGDFELRHPRRPVLFQKSFKGLVEVRAKTTRHQSAAHVRTAGRAAVRDGENRVGLERNVVLVQPGDHFMDAVLADFLEVCHFREQTGISGIDKVTEQMQFVVVELRGQFCGGDELEAGRLAGGARAVTPFHRVVIGHRNGGQSELSGAPGQFFGCVSAVGKNRVQMEVSEHRSNAGCGMRNAEWLAGSVPAAGGRLET